MFVSSGQFFVFLACVGFGGIAGIILCAPKVIKFYLKNKIFGGVLDVIFFVGLGILYIHYSFSLGFPNFRMYMMMGVFVGLIMCFKSFHIILAKLLKK